MSQLTFQRIHLVFACIGWFVLASTLKLAASTFTDPASTLPFAQRTGVRMYDRIVDEPREVPNPWNRNLEHTNLYGDMMKQAGFATAFVTPMSDSSGGKDYTSLVDHADILSVHAGAAPKIVARTRQKFVRGSRARCSTAPR